MNIAIFGGSFDPPHIGHEAIINKSLEVLDIDQLYIIPTFLNPFKSKSYFSAKDRFDMLTIAFKDRKIKICDFETKQNKPNPTIDTVNYIISTVKPDKLYLIIGADNLQKIHLWDDFNLLKDLVSFVVVSRNGAKLKNDIINFINIHLDIDVSSTTLRENLNLEYIPKKIQKKVKELWKIE